MCAWSLQDFKIVGFSVCWSNLRFACALRISPTKIIFVGEILVPMALFQLQQSSEIKRCWSLLDLRIPQNHLFVREILFNCPFSTAAKQYDQKVLVTSKSEDPFCARKSSKLVHCVRVARNETKRLQMCQIYLMFWIVMSKRISHVIWNHWNNKFQCAACWLFIELRYGTQFESHRELLAIIFWSNRRWSDPWYTF